MFCGLITKITGAKLVLYLIKSMPEMLKLLLAILRDVLYAGGTRLTLLIS